MQQLVARPRVSPSSPLSFLIAVTLAALSPITADEAAAADLPPGTLLLPESALPEYEAKIDHARLIGDKSHEVLKLGAKVYAQVCFNCHGDASVAGSLPNSLRFAQGEFQHGSDPHTMYETITRGWRLMPPQVQLTPREKYAVIHHIREKLIKGGNSAQYFKVDENYLASLPQGSDLGPAPVKSLPWKEMDYGSFLIGSFEIATPEERAAGSPEKVTSDSNIAYKGIAQRLDPGAGGIATGRTWSAFEHDTLRVAGVWTGEGFIDWQGINFNGRHVVRPRTIGEPLMEIADGPGWANPETGSFDDARFQAADGFRYGPLPRSWGRYRGLHRHGERLVISYTVGDAEILESHELDAAGNFVRQLNIGRSSTDLTLRVAPATLPLTQAGVNAANMSNTDGYWTCTVAAGNTPVNIAFAVRTTTEESPEGLAPRDLQPFTRGGPAQWPDPVVSPIVRGEQDGAFQWDTFSMPFANPWKSRLRATGIDFTADGESAVMCCWDGDVWRVDGIADEGATTASWRRIASGLFQPLGIKIVKDRIHVCCRDQIVRLIDLDGDGETDFYQNFNSDHQVTEHYHEFAMGLQADDAGNLYYARSARHARPPLVPHHGTLLKVSADGSRTEILAKGFRAANGVCRNADGSFFVTDQEGHWNPMNRINHVIPGDHFYGNMWGYGAPEDSSDAAMEPPLCWVDKGFDRSPAELLEIDSQSWGPLDGKLLHISYGHGRLEIVPHEKLPDGRLQGGMCRLPIPDLPTGIMRGRFHPHDGHLYTCGMAAWGTARMQQPGGFYRIRATGKPAHLPVAMHAHAGGVDITFSDPLDPASINDPAEQFRVSSWALERTAKYGSQHLDKKSHAVTAASLSQDGRTLELAIDAMAPAWQMAIKYQLKGANGQSVNGEIQNTIHELGSGE